MQSSHYLVSVPALQVIGNEAATLKRRSQSDNTETILSLGDAESYHI